MSFTVSEGIHYRKDVKLNIPRLTDLQHMVKKLDFVHFRLFYFSSSMKKSQNKVVSTIILGD